MSGSFNVRNRHLNKLLDEKGINTDEVWASIALHGGSVGHLDFLTKDEKAVFKTAFEIDQAWVIDLAGDRAPLIDQSQSVNVFVPPNVHKRELHEIHFQAWKKGVKSLYYCRSLSIQRAEKNEDTSNDFSVKAPDSIDSAGEQNYEECLACQ